LNIIRKKIGVAEGKILLQAHTIEKLDDKKKFILENIKNQELNEFYRTLSPKQVRDRIRKHVAKVPFIFYFFDEIFVNLIVKFLEKKIETNIKRVRPQQ